MEITLRQLVLCPLDTDWQPEIPDPRQGSLCELGLLGARVTDDLPDRYKIGDQLLQHISFMGCSPAVEFEPVSDSQIDWASFIYVHLPAPMPESVWVADRQMAKPACPCCKKRMTDWYGAYSPEEGHLNCRYCDTASPVCAWNWFNAGGCGRFFISIVNVFPKEALPSDNFLQQLASLTGTNWRCFYVNAPLIGT